jgi:hypothetical protein
MVASRQASWPPPQKDEIIAAVWPGTVVEDSNLTVQISALRRVLDEGRSYGSYIQTVPGRGYRFVAPVTHPEGEVRSGDSLMDSDGKLDDDDALELVVPPLISSSPVVMARRRRAIGSVIVASFAAVLVLGIMTPKQARFVQEYLIDLNAAQAAIRAGYSAKTARVIGHENLTNPDIARSAV